MHRALLIFNPRAGQRDATPVVEHVLGILENGFPSIEAVSTHGPGHATELARGAERGGYGVVFTLGGDGTQREAACGLLGSRVPLGILPAGTTNVLAHALRLPRRPSAAAAWYARAVAGGGGLLPTREIDVGYCGERPFLMMASAGFDARVMAAVDPDAKRRWGQLAIAWRGLREWWRNERRVYEVEADGRTLCASWVVLSNIPHYAGPWELCPAARLDDRRLDLLLHAPPSRGAVLSFALDLLLTAHTGRSDVRILTPTRVVIRGRGPLAVQIDGDPYEEHLPLVLGLHEKTLSVLAPPLSAPPPASSPDRRRQAGNGAELSRLRREPRGAPERPSAAVRRCA